MHEFAWAFRSNLFLALSDINNQNQQDSVYAEDKQQALSHADDRK